MDFRIKPKDEGDVAYEQGRQARNQGLEEDSPYPAGTELDDQWCFGWEDRDMELEDEGE